MCLTREQTRQRLLDDAQAIFVKKGFVAASVEDVAAAADYSRGAFYSNFGSTSELFLELRRITLARFGARRHAVANACGTTCARPHRAVRRRAVLLFVGPTIGAGRDRGKRARGVFRAGGVRGFVSALRALPAALGGLAFARWIASTPH